MLRALAALALVLAATGCRPLLDGGWQGTAACPNEAYPISAIFNETKDGEVEGVVYIEGINIIIGDSGSGDSARKRSRDVAHAGSRRQSVSSEHDWPSSSM